MAFDFIEGGAGDELTVAENRRAFGRWALRPRYLRDVARRDQTLTVFDAPLSTPVILGPTGLQRIAHVEGELGAARAAAAEGTVYVATSHSSYAIEDIVARAGAASVWFQLYLWRDRGRSREMLDRARAAGLPVLFVTVDAPVLGKRERDLRNGFSIPLKPSAGMVADLALHPRWLVHYARGGPITFANYTHMGAGRKPKALFRYINEELSHPGATIADLAWLREEWHGPLVVKGTLTAEDAVEAVDAGADGICVSNHGGRQLDGAVATVDALPAVVEAVGDRAVVLMDGGVRRGADVAKALALGARAVLIGRPYVYGLAWDGERGVRRVVELLKEEIDITLAMLGTPELARLGRDSVERVPA
jgi:isopentenyl diphosphate isomerase/L-lactate dehydrogenase-like FMN-dependent dehydrogenase